MCVYNLQSEWERQHQERWGPASDRRERVERGESGEDVYANSVEAHADSLDEGESEDSDSDAVFFLKFLRHGDGDDEGADGRRAELL